MLKNNSTSLHELQKAQKKKAETALGSKIH